MDVLGWLGGQIERFVSLVNKDLYLYINGFVLLEFLDGQIIRRCAEITKHKLTKLFQHLPNPFTNSSMVPYTTGKTRKSLHFYTYLLVKRKSSKALASSGHMVSNFPEGACWRATGRPTNSTLSREDTASFHVLSDGHAYFRPRGIRKVYSEGGVGSLKYIFFCHVSCFIRSQVTCDKKGREGQDCFRIAVFRYVAVCMSEGI